MMQQYENTMKRNMASAEKDLKKPEDRRGFVIGAVAGLWKAYHLNHQINESQFDRLIGVLSSFSKGEYRDFIREQVQACKGGNPPIIIGY